MDDSTYKKLSALVDTWLTVHTGESFDLDIICRQLQIAERENRHYVAQKLSYEVSQGKLEKSNRIYRYINSTKDLINWVLSTSTSTLSIKWPRGRDGTKFGFDGCVCISPGDILVVAGVSNMGKALKNGTPILTPNGWVDIEKLKIGDSVYSPSGYHTIIKGVYPQGIREVYRLSFNDGSWIDADKDHIWKIQTPNARTHKYTGHGNPSSHYQEWTMTTTESLVTRYGIGNIKANKRFAIPTNNPIIFDSHPVKMNPYLLGLLLGDGCFGKTSIKFSTEQSCFLDFMRQEGINPIHINAYDYRLNGLVPIIRSLGLDQLNSHNKFIPKEYLWNDVATRLRIFRGLMDTDGSIDKNREVEYTSVSEQLALDVQWLARSLGGRASIHKGQSSYVYKGYIKEGIRYRVNIKMSICPFALQEKANKFNAYKKTLNRIIRRIDRVDDAECTCIKVASPDGLFIAKDFIVTHNTTFAQNFLWENMDSYPCVLMGNEYAPDKFKRRVSRMTWANPLDAEGKPKFELIRRFENWKDIVEPDKITIIDWIALPANELYNIGHVIQGIQSKLKNGICLIVLQKDEAATLGRGRAFSEELSSLYLTIDKGRLTVRKAKEWFEHNPNHEVYGFDITGGGVEFRNIRELAKCFECRGSGQYRGGECLSCGGTGYIDKKPLETP